MPPLLHLLQTGSHAIKCHATVIMGAFSKIPGYCEPIGNEGFIKVIVMQLAALPAVNLHVIEFYLLIPVVGTAMQRFGDSVGEFSSEQEE